MTTAVRTGTRWGRASIAMGCGFGALASVASLVVTHVLALNFSIQNSGAKFSTSAIYAVNAGLGMTTATTASGTTKPVLRAGFATARLDGLCVSKVETVALPGGLNLSVTLRLTSGDGALSTTSPANQESPYTDIAANNVTFDITSLRAMTQPGQAGNGVQLNGLDEIGIATPDIQTTPGITNPLGGLTTNNGEGWFGISGTSATFYSVKGLLWDAQISGNIALPNLSISTSTNGSAECWTSQTTTSDLPR